MSGKYSCCDEKIQTKCFMNFIAFIISILTVESIYSIQTANNLFSKKAFNRLRFFEQALGSWVINK